MNTPQNKKPVPFHMATPAEQERRIKALAQMVADLARGKRGQAHGFSLN